MTDKQDDKSPCEKLSLQNTELYAMIQAIRNEITQLKRKLRDQAHSK